MLNHMLKLAERIMDGRMKVVNVCIDLNIMQICAHVAVASTNSRTSRYYSFKNKKGFIIHAVPFEQVLSDFF